MMYSKWDEIILKVEDRFGHNDVYYSRLKVMIIGIDGDYDDEYDGDGDHFVQYLCYVPPYERIPYGFSTFTITKRHVSTLNIDAKFIGDTGCFITAKTPTYKHIPATLGEKCDKCQTFFEGVERNSDGAYRCRACRENPYR